MTAAPSKHQAPLTGIHLSPAAIAEVQRLWSRQKDAELRFRLAVEVGGCAEFFYKLGFDKLLHPDDQVYRCQDLDVVVDRVSLPYVQGLRIDYSEDLMGGGFRFQNPNAIRSCSCGNSFSVNRQLEAAL